ncbi:MAG: class I SAM-dependent RNA methyltransferase [Desulfobacteraceae bacterium]|nr:MAG: class I SAM-dependent RNA methyltransferase [Desulfobacteraceae bacterium]
MKSERANGLIKKKPGKAKRWGAVFSYQMDSRYFVQVAEGLEEAGAVELEELGAEEIRLDFRGIHFQADKKTFYRINYSTRLASRCLAPLVSFDCPNTDSLYEKAKQVCWEALFSFGDTFAVSGHVSGSAVSHSKYASLRLKDAVADYFVEKTGTRPDVSVDNPDILLNLNIRKDRAEISLDASGGALHKRGYREETVSAPMQETVAAAIIRFTEWDGSVPLYDPLCGSGTLLSEALMRYSNIPAGVFRKKFGFEALPDFDGAIWKRVRSEAEQRIRELPKGLLAGSDISGKAVSAARTNLMGLHFGGNVQIEKTDFRNLPAMEGCILVTNPPYGIRMGKGVDLEKFYKDFGDFLKQKCKGSTAYIFFGEREHIRKIGLKASWKKPIRTGGLDGRLVKYEIY